MCVWRLYTSHTPHSLCSCSRFCFRCTRTKSAGVKPENKSSNRLVRVWRVVEFEENKAFSLEVLPFHLRLPTIKPAIMYTQTVSETTKMYTKHPSKHPCKMASTSAESDRAPALICRLARVPLSSRTRHLSSSAHATLNSFNHPAATNAEPDPSRVIAIGAKEGADVGTGVNGTPGGRNGEYVMSKVVCVS